MSAKSHPPTQAKSAPPPALATMLATLFWVGRIPFAPGTWGSLAALPLGIAIRHAFGDFALLGAVIVCFAIGWWAATAYARARGEDDPSAVVIDEAAGQWIVLLIAPPTAIGYSVAFLLFRTMDILKPFPINWLDKHLKGGFGIMFDDIVAGLYAAAALYALVYVGLIGIA